MKNFSLKKLIFSGAAIVLLLGIIIGGLHIMESTVFNPENPAENSESTSSKTVEKENVKYFPRQDITTILLMGIDSLEEAQESEYYVNDGLADAVAVLIFDEKNKTINAIALNRDSVVEMPILGLGGKFAGTTVGQLALAHTYGSGLNDSCENVEWTVSNLLNGYEIDYYISLNMGAIPAVNDAVGGVTVNVKDDFSAVDSDIKKGEYTLMGDEALTFIRARKDLGDQLNISRMERHKEYVNGFMEAFRKKSEENNLFALDLYEAAEGYMVTDCSGDTLASLAERYEDYEMGDIVSPKGENVINKDHYEFHIDEEDLENIILEYLYAPK